MSPKSGDTVRVHYTGHLSDGSQFDSSEGREPIEFTLGAGEVIPGFDEAVSGLNVGDSATVTIPAAEAYGEKEEGMVQSVPLSMFPEKPEVGWLIELASPDGQRLAATVVEIGDEDVLIDLNHPLAGQDLTFDLQLVEVVEA